MVNALSRCFRTTAICSNSDMPGAVVITDAWSTGDQPRLRLIRFSVRALLALWRLRPDVVHAVTPGSVPAAVLYRWLRRDSRLIFEIHGLMRYEMQMAKRRARWLFSALDRVGLPQADEVIAMSHAQAREIRRLYSVDAERVHVLWGPVDLDDYPFRILQRSRPSGPLRIGYLGGGSFWQDLSTVAQAAAILQADERLTFLLAGFAPDQIERSPNIQFLGELAWDQGPRFLTGCDILLSPRVDGQVTALQYPHKLSHYLAAGRPIIGADVNDQGLIIRRAACGLPFVAGDVESLVGAIRRLAGCTDRQRAEMGRRARRFAERYLSLERLVDELRIVYGI